jgi:hypothetical protein
MDDEDEDEGWMREGCTPSKYSGQAHGKAFISHALSPPAQPLHKLLFFDWWVSPGAYTSLFGQKGEVDESSSLPPKITRFFALCAHHRRLFFIQHLYSTKVSK